MPHSTIGESPFWLTYGTEAVIPIKANELGWQASADTDFDTNAANLREELKFINAVRTEASLQEIASKQKIAAQHNKRVVIREFEVGDLVLPLNKNDSEEGKLAANWEGPYMILMKTGQEPTT